MKTPIFKLFLATIIVFSFTACSKLDKNSGSDSNKAKLQVFLTDDPGPYQEVLIDVQDVKINFTDDSTNGWQSLANVKKGQYDLLTLVNDKDTMLADAKINTGTIQQIRLVLGTENFVKVNDNLIKLETPSGRQSGLKLNIHQDVVAGILYKVILDFDAGKSLHKTGNGKYMLKPVIRTSLEAQGGSIQGWVLPDTITTSVFAIQTPDTIASTFTSSTGGYLIRGLPAGTYSLSFVPGDTTFVDEVRNGITVTTETVTIVDTVHLHQ
jgi:Domain of unknown function (DUF4382)